MGVFWKRNTVKFPYYFPQILFKFITYFWKWNNLLFVWHEVFSLCTSSEECTVSNWQSEIKIPAARPPYCVVSCPVCHPFPRRTLICSNTRCSPFYVSSFTKTHVFHNILFFISLKKRHHWREIDVVDRNEKRVRHDAWKSWNWLFWNSLSMRSPPLNF